MPLSLSMTYSHTRLVYHVFLSDSHAMPSSICGGLCQPVALRFQFPDPLHQLWNSVAGGRDIEDVSLGRDYIISQSF